MPPQVKYYKNFSDFNFIKFEPVEGTYKSPNDYFKAGFDENGKCWTVEHFEKAPRFSKFKMNLYEFEGFNAYTLLEEYDSEPSYEPVVFIVTKPQSKAFMLNVVPQFGENKRTQTLFDDGLPVKDLESVSAIMTLDEKFFATSLIRIHNSKLIYGSQMKYEEGSTYLEKERIYLFTNPEKDEAAKIYENTCLLDIESAFETYYEVVFLAEPNIHPPDRIMPLWVWGGTHSYER